MNFKVKSFMYFATLVLAVLAYHNMNNANTVQNTELAENTVENVSIQEALH